VLLLKIVAYQENPYDREKDIADIAVILERHQPGDDRRYADGVLAAGLTYDAAGAYCIGQDLRRLCADDEKILVGQFNAKLLDERSRPYSVLARVLGRSLEDDGDNTRPDSLIRAFTAGFAAES
jgi:hypothetical protein